jgi:hypothetical protein
MPSLSGPTTRICATCSTLVSWTTVASSGSADFIPAVIFWLVAYFWAVDLAFFSSAFAISLEDFRE